MIMSLAVSMPALVSKECRLNEVVHRHELGSIGVYTSCVRAGYQSRLNDIVR